MHDFTISQFGRDTLTWICGFAIPVLTALYAHINKKIPFKIVFSNRDDRSYVTTEMLETNCTSRQTLLDKKLDGHFTRLYKAQEENAKLLQDLIVKTEGRISRLEGKMSVTEHRR